MGTENLKTERRKTTEKGVKAGDLQIVRKPIASSRVA